MQKRLIYLLGIVTLLVFPLPALWALWYFENLDPWQVLDLQSVWHPYTLLGLEWGFFYAAVSMISFQSDLFEGEMQKQEKVMASLRLNIFDKFFLSFCAGFGEEILFRAGVQHWLGVVITAIVFIAIHGYFSLKNPRMSVYGLLILPFILSLGYWLSEMGIWFCIAAHFGYDLILFLYMRNDQ